MDPTEYQILSENLIKQGSGEKNWKEDGNVVPWLSVYTAECFAQKNQTGRDIRTDEIMNVDDACWVGEQQECLPWGPSVPGGLVFHPVPEKRENKSFDSQDTLIRSRETLSSCVAVLPNMLRRSGTCNGKWNKNPDCSFKWLPKGPWQLELPVSGLFGFYCLPERVLSIGDATLQTIPPSIPARPWSSPQLPSFSALLCPSFEHGVTARQSTPSPCLGV